MQLSTHDLYIHQTTDPWAHQRPLSYRLAHTISEALEAGIWWEGRKRRTAAQLEELLDRVESRIQRRLVRRASSFAMKAAA